MRRRLIAGVALAVMLGYPIAAAHAGQLALSRFPAPDADSERRPVVTGVPIYPEQALDERRSGEVVVCFRIRRDGRVVRPQVKRSSDRIFNRAALRAARETRYAPAVPGARNANTTECMTFRFELESLARRSDDDRAR